MSYLLFMDESGKDRQESPYEVLAGICIDDRELWNLINQIHQAEITYFGQRVTKGTLELKAKELLKKKTFRHASRRTINTDENRTKLANRAIRRGSLEQDNTERGVAVELELAALGQAKIAFAKKTHGAMHSIQG